MSDVAKDSDGAQRENIPDIDYGDLWEVKQEAGFDYDQQLAIESKCESLEVGDEVVINNRQRALTVVPHEEAEELLKMAFGETLFLKGNGTEYRLRWDNGVPRLDRGDFSDEEHVAFLRIKSKADEAAGQLVTDGGKSATGAQQPEGFFLEVDDEDAIVAVQLRAIDENGDGMVVGGLECDPGRYELRKVEGNDA